MVTENRLGELEREATAAYTSLCLAMDEKDISAARFAQAEYQVMQGTIERLENGGRSEQFSNHRSHANIGFAASYSVGHMSFDNQNPPSKYTTQDLIDNSRDIMRIQTIAEDMAVSMDFAGIKAALDHYRG